MFNTAFGESVTVTRTPPSPDWLIVCVFRERVTVTCSPPSDGSGFPRSAHAPSTASSTTSGTDATPTCAPVSHTRPAAMPAQHPPKPASAASTATSHRLRSRTALTPA